MTIDQLIDERAEARLAKQYKRCDEIRDVLDVELVFVFDAAYGQEIYYLTKGYFRKKSGVMTNRQYVEWRIREDSRMERIFQGWLTTMDINFRK